MHFDTKIAIVIRTDLETWQKLNEASSWHRASRLLSRHVLAIPMRTVQTIICR